VSFGPAAETTPTARTPGFDTNERAVVIGDRDYAVDDVAVVDAQQVVQSLGVCGKPL
jgi:hypothetical protein